MMVFNLFDKKKSARKMEDLISGYSIYQKTLEHLAKAQSFQKLNRDEEAQQLLLESERLLINHLNKNQRDTNAHMVLCLFYKEIRAQDKAVAILNRLLKPAEFQLPEEERLILLGELQKIQRERPSQEKSIKDPQDFTQVYCCQNCGRLHNFVSMPCPNCNWSPKTLEETARSAILSNSYIKIPGLLIMSRQMANERSAQDIVPNLANDAKALLSATKSRQAIEKVFSLLKETAHENHRNINQIRQCEECGTRILLSNAEECQSCGEPISWPDMLRTLVCIDNLLWLFEQRSEVSSKNATDDFVCVLVAMVNSLLRKQELPSEQNRKYALSLLKEMVAIYDLNKGAIIDTKSPTALEVYLIEANMRDDSQSYGTFWINELNYFVNRMLHGIRQ